jgi:hypothetical protein
VINGTNLLGKDNPSFPIGNTAGTIKLLAAVPAQLTAPPSPRELSRLCLPAWLTSLPHRISTRLYVRNDTEASWWRWQITELRGGFARSYRDVRFDVLRQLHELTAWRNPVRTGSPDEPEGPPRSLRPVLPRGPGWRRHRPPPARSGIQIKPINLPNGSWRLFHVRPSPPRGV